jgi:hypothetical protein
VEIINNSITIQDNEERIEVVDFGSLDECRHANQLIPGGTITHNGETTPIKKPVQKLREKPAAKPASKTEWNKVIPAILPTIDPIRGLSSKVAQCINFNILEFIEVGGKENPNKQPIQKTRRPRS